MRVLVVKLTSMGDLIHTLPALTDANRAIPAIQFDWLVDESCADIPRLHTGVKRIMTTAFRRWSKAKWQALRTGEFRQFFKALRSHDYDIVLDAQSNLKSAIMTRFCKGLRCGIDSAGVREYGAHFAYQKTFSIPTCREAHALVRQRLLFSKALGYPMPLQLPDFGIDTKRLPSRTFNLPDPYLLFIHNTTWASKHWPETYWVALIKLANQAGYHVALPWGNQKEEARAKRLASGATHASVLPAQTIMEKAGVIMDAKGVVTIDTGLAHLTAAMNIPAVHLYGPTNKHLLAVDNTHQTFLSADYPCAPCYLQQCQFGEESACFMNRLTPTTVWDAFCFNINKKR